MSESSLLQINPSQFRLYEAIHNLPPGNRELVLKPGNDPRRKLSQGQTVYLWEGEAGHRLVGKGTVLSEQQPRPQPNWQHRFAHGAPLPTDERAGIRVDLRIDPPISRARIQQDPVLAAATFFKNKSNVQGSIFRVEAGEAEALDNLIDIERRRAGAFSDEVPRDYLDVLASADCNGDFEIDSEHDSRERQLRAIAIRQGQPKFRSNLLEAYGNRCSVTDCDVPEALEAAHILPYLNDERNHISNGLLLRADVHTLFDLGLLAVGDGFEILLASSLRNTNFGIALSGRKLRVPESSAAAPNLDALKRHRERSSV